jgi:anti-anti-sigma factor
VVDREGCSCSARHAAPPSRSGRFAIAADDLVARTVLLRAFGELDASSCDELVRAVAAAVAADRSVRLDTVGVDFIDSSGLHALARLRRQHGTRFELRPQGRAVTRLLEITGTTSLFEAMHDAPEGAFYIIVETRPDITLMSATGDVDGSNSVMLGAAIDRALTAAGPVELDLSAVTFIDSSGLRVLLAFRSGHGDRFRLARPSRVVKRILEITASEGIFDL